jgi:hypothetical protein
VKPEQVDREARHAAWKDYVTNWPRDEGAAFEYGWRAGQAFALSNLASITKLIDQLDRVAASRRRYGQGCELSFATELEEAKRFIKGIIYLTTP